MPKSAPALAKLSRPRLHTALKRERLFKRLDARKSYPVIWVNGPPGAGKTTAVASYLEARKLATHWYQVDEGDHDIASLFFHLGALAKQAKARGQVALPYFTPEYSADLSGFARRFFRALFACLDKSAVLVFDNCQDAACEAFHGALRHASEEVPHGANLILISRLALPPELARLATNRKIHEIGWDELKLTEQEANALAKASGVEDQAWVAQLNHRCEGWVAGLMLLLGSHSADQAAQLKSKEAIFNYFAGEILAAIEPNAREVLMRCALFPQISASLAEEISDHADAGKVLDAMYRKHFLVDRKVEAELTYQYHDLLREFLLERLRETHAASALAALRARAGRLLQQRGQIAEAAQLLREAADWESLTHLLQQHAAALIDQGRWQTLNECFEGLPEQWLHRDAWLIYWRGNAQMPVDLNVARRLLEEAYTRFCSEGDIAGQSTAILDLSDVVFLTHACVDAFDAWIPVMEQVVLQIDKLPSLNVKLRAWVGYLALVAHRGAGSNTLDQGRDWLLRQVDSGTLSPNQELDAAEVCLHVAFVSANSALARRMAKHLEAIIDREHLLTPHVKLWTLVWLGFFHMVEGRSQPASDLLRRAKTEAQRQGFNVAAIHAGCALARLLTLCGKMTEASALLKELSDEVTSPGERMVYHVAQALHALLDGELNHCTANLAQARVHAEQHGIHFWIAEISLAQAATLAAAGQVVEAQQALSTGKQILAMAPANFLLGLAAFAEADILVANGKRDAGLATLAHALDQAANPIKAGNLSWAHANLPRLLAIAFDLGINTEIATVLVHRYRIRPPSMASMAWPWPIKLCALGELYIEVKGSRYAGTTKSHYKLLQLLKILIAMGGRQVPMDGVTSHLWPDAEGDLAANNLRTALHRLRKLLGHEEAILLRDNKLSFSAEWCWLDTWAFEALTQDYEADNESAQTRLERALGLYRGHLLSAQSEGWVIAQRDKLRARFQRAAVTLAQAWEDSGAWAKAEALYQSCLERDPASEVLYRNLMLHLKRRGRHGEALEVYRRCERVLSRALARKPSPETRSVFESLHEAQ